MSETATRKSWPSVEELHADFIRRYGIRWRLCWELGLAEEPDLERKFMQELGAGSGPREPADDTGIAEWERESWIALLGTLAFRALADDDRFWLREIARVFGRTEQARAFGLLSQ